MAEKLTISWPRIFAEGSAIVVSILLAFWIQAWWDNRQEAEEVNALLTALLEQSREMQVLRMGRKEFLEAMIDACRQLLEIARNPEKDFGDEQIDYLLNDTTYVGGSFQTDMPVLQSLFLGGEVSALQDQRLRTLLASLRLALEYENQYAEREVQFVESRYYPFLDRHASVAQIYAADDGQPGVKYLAGVEAAQYPIGSETEVSERISHRELLAIPEFQNLLVQRVNVLNNLIGWETTIYDVDKSVQQIIDMLEAEPGPPGKL